MPPEFSKQAYLDALYAELRSPICNTSEEGHRQMAYYDVRGYIHYVNGRIYDVLEGRNTRDNAYAAAYAWYPDEVTQHFPAPEVEPRVSAAELHEDMRKVRRIQELAGYSNYVDGLKWIDRRVIRDCIFVRRNGDAIELHFAKPDRPPVVLPIIHAGTFVALCEDPDITPDKVIDFLKADGFSIEPEKIIRSLVPKIRPEYLRPIIDWIESIKLPDLYQRKFNAIFLLDILRRRYADYQHGESSATQVDVQRDRVDELRDFMIDLVRFLESVRLDEEGGGGRSALNEPPSGGMPPEEPVPLPPGGRKPRAIEGPQGRPGTSLTARGALLSTRTTGFGRKDGPLPALYEVERLQTADDRGIAGQMDSLLWHIYQFVHRIPADRLAEVGTFFDRVAALKMRFPAVESERPTPLESLTLLMIHVQQILHRMGNAIYFQQTMDGTLDFPDRTGNFDVDTMLVHPKHFAEESAFHLTEQLCYSWSNSLDRLGYEHMYMTDYLREIVPGVRARIIDVMEQRSQQQVGGSRPKLGYEQ